MIKQQDGFTLVELLIAMTVFSFMMIFVSVAFINIVRIHQAGTASRAVQQNARLALDEIIASARGANTAKAKGTGTVVDPYRVCFSTGVGVTEYYLDDSSVANPGQLRTGTSDLNCTPGNSSWQVINDTSVLFLRMSVFIAQPLGTGLGTVEVTLTAASRDNLDPGEVNLSTNPPSCNPGPGSQFCSVTSVTSTASLKGGN